jgi:hypothetical protein
MPIWHPWRRPILSPACGRSGPSWPADPAAVLAPI